MSHPQPRIIGVLANGAGRRLQAGSPELEGLRRGLQALGHEEGRDFVIESRDGAPDQAGAHAQDLARAGVAAIVAASTRDAAAAQKATTTIPVVFVSPDPVGVGLVRSVERPGGNLTGFTGADRSSQFELLRRLIPDLRRVAILADTSYLPAPGVLREIQAGAHADGLEPLTFEVATLQDVAAAFAAMVEQQAQAAIVSVAPLFAQNPAEIARGALARRVPLGASYPALAEAGALYARWPDFAQVFERAAGFLDRIFKGEDPAEMPMAAIGPPRLILNLATARILGLDIAPDVREQADVVIS